MGIEVATIVSGALSALAVVLAGVFSFWAVARQHRVSKMQTEIDKLKKEIRDRIILEYAAISTLSEETDLSSWSAQKRLRERAIEMGGDRPSFRPADVGLSFTPDA